MSTKLIAFHWRLLKNACPSNTVLKLLPKLNTPPTNAVMLLSELIPTKVQGSLSTQVAIIGNTYLRAPPSSPAHDHSSQTTPQWRRWWYLCVFTKTDPRSVEWQKVGHVSPRRQVSTPNIQHLKVKYCWWKESCTTKHVWNPVNNGIFTISTGAGFLPSTICLNYKPFSDLRIVFRISAIFTCHRLS